MAKLDLPSSLGSARCVVLTGVHGFIGGRVLEEGLRHFGKSFRMVGSDLEGTETRTAARRAREAGAFDFVPREALLEKLRSGELVPDLIIHNGACSSTTETDPEVFRVLNLESSKALWEVCANRQIPLIYASSASVYGDGLQGFDDLPSSLQNYSALNLYAGSKLDFDRFAAQAPMEPPRWVGLRYFNVYGGCEDHKGGQASMVFHGFRQVSSQGKIRLFKGDPGASLEDAQVPDLDKRRYPDGEQRRDFVYVADIVSLTWQLAAQALAAESVWTGALGRVWSRKGFFLNAGTGQARTWNDLAKAVCAAMGKAAPVIEYIDMPESLKRQYQNFTEARHGAAEALDLPFAWTALEDGVWDYVRHDLMKMEEPDRET